MEPVSSNLASDCAAYENQLKIELFSTTRKTIMEKI